ncbi:thioester domain-containing protein [Lysinibacter cavernae]|uniref:TQXA domain-containing protein n=1 Tax=Lysinibacter cavernae TaxID=1640652 RepID=A0A7X5R2X6_9MICO|nr:thioester domain-containing protein [Lysinibacter cavernae]NIH54631.1 TQXA domain-containing protein [Lysinibacter cavernae]
MFQTSSFFTRRRTVFTAALAALIAVLMVFAGSTASQATPSGTATNSNKGSLYGMPQPDGSVAGKNGDMFKFTLKDDAGVSSTFFTYCIEGNIPIGVAKPYGESGWSSVPYNSFIPNAGKVLWVLGHGYPNLTGAQLAAASGIAGVTDLDAITATQFAIWNLTDPSIAGGRLFPSPATVPQDLVTYPRSTIIQNLMVWMLNNAVDGATEPTPSLTVTPSSLTAPLSGHAGPFTVHTTASTGASITSTVAIVDATGQPITGPVLNGGQFYLDASGLQVGETVSASATATSATISVGRVFVPTDPASRWQGLIVASQDTVGTAQTTASLTVTDALPGALAIHKQDAQHTSVSLGGAVFQVFNESGAVVTTLTTDADGNAQADGLEPGTYRVVEQSAPTGYALDVTPHEVAVTADATETLIVDNTASAVPSGALSLHKQDAADATNSLEDAVFDVINANNQTVATMTTDATGNASVDGLSPGSYTVVERTAPTGYVLDITPHEITVLDGTTQSTTITNAAAPAPTPKPTDSVTPSSGPSATPEGGTALAVTGTNQSPYGLAAIAFVLGAIVLVANARRQRQTRTV